MKRTKIAERQRFADDLARRDALRGTAPLKPRKKVPRKRKLGRLHVSGPGSGWPDHVLSYETGNLLVGAVVQVRGWAVGLELQGRHGNPWLNVYLGCWCIELYLDRDGGLEDA